LVKEKKHQQQQQEKEGNILNRMKIEKNGLNFF